MSPAQEVPTNVHIPRRFRRRPDESGAVVIEFALLVPLPLLLVFGTVQYGMYFYARQAGSDIARDAARRAAVSDPVSCADFRAAVQAGIDSVAGSGDTDFIKRTYSRRPVGRTGTILSMVKVRLENVENPAPEECP